MVAAFSSKFFFSFQIQDMIGPYVAIRRRIIILNGPDIKTNIVYLNQSGISLTNILEYPIILHYTRDELKHRINCLSQRQETVTTHAICNGFYGKDFVRKSNQINKHWLDTLAEKLECSVTLLVTELATKCPNKMNPRSQTDILEKIDLLHQSGATKNQILNSPYVLDRSKKRLKQRCEEVIQLGFIDPFPLKMIARGKLEYRTMLENRIKREKTSKI